MHGVLTVVVEALLFEQLRDYLILHTDLLMVESLHYRWKANYSKIILIFFYLDGCPFPALLLSVALKLTLALSAHLLIFFLVRH